jgi:oxygen-independent coproporphyrinogen-3 oxidase
MAGIYIHIPFCRQACYYCDFHFSISLKNKKDFLAALKKEIELQKDYLGTKNISTIYFGGGTPSLLSKEEILEIFSSLSNHFAIEKNAEITLEANPDDLSKEKLKELSQTPINRLSIGIQSFSDADLKFLHRVHNSSEAINSVKNAQQEGFKNITVDLIYGIQTLSNEQWKKNIEKVLSLNVQHISCYSLTIEPRTALHSFIKKGEIKNIDSEKSALQFNILMKEMKKNNFIHYEISNFGKEFFFSKHNSSYWKGEKYLGLGPSAHSYDRNSRQWNVSSNSAYINSLSKNKIPFEREILTLEQKFNEYVMISLRTMWGIDLKFVKKNFGENLFSHLKKEIQKHFSEELISKEKEMVALTPKGKLFADKIASDLFFLN